MGKSAHAPKGRDGSAVRYLRRERMKETNIVGEGQ